MCKGTQISPILVRFSSFYLSDILMITTCQKDLLPIHHRRAYRPDLWNRKPSRKAHFSPRSRIGLLIQKHILTRKRTASSAVWEKPWSSEIKYLRSLLALVSKQRFLNVQSTGKKDGNVSGLWKRTGRRLKGHFVDSVAVLLNCPTGDMILVFPSTGPWGVIQELPQKHA